MAISDNELNSLKNQWNNLSYADQQAKLSSNSKLQWALNSLWLSVKSAPTSSNVQTNTNANSSVNWTKWTNTTPSTTNTQNWNNGNGTNWGFSNNSSTTNNAAWYNQVKPEEVNNRTRATNSTVDNLWYQWDKLTYEQQQEKFNQTPALRTAVEKLWLKIKWPNDVTPTTTRTTNTGTANTGTTWTTWSTWTDKTNPDWWDYQDNSEARMYEMAGHLMEYEQTMPFLFDDYDSFYNFFIKDKGRSQDQIDFLNNYFDKLQKYWKYDWATWSDIGKWLANGIIPEDYLPFLKMRDPVKYQEAMYAMKDAQDALSNEQNLETLINNAGLWNKDDPAYIKWAKANWFLIDENWDYVDDKINVEATEQEKALVDEYSKLASEQLEDANTYRDLMSTLRKQYPDADESTLMILAGDRWKKIQDRMDTRNVTMTKIQWQVDYLQNERKLQSDARKQTLTNLQKAYGMYYEYTPEWMSELAQAQYEATNISLDKAESGTDAQKQMALQNVLEWYYDKYWSIIERPMQQVINDVMKYAKENWVTLSQALDENFTSFLKQKPWYKSLSSWSWNWYKWTKIWQDEDGNDVYWFVDETAWTVKPYGNTWSAGVNDTWYTWWVAWSQWGNGNQVILDEDMVETSVMDWYWHQAKFKSTMAEKVNEAAKILKEQYWIDLQIQDAYRTYEQQKQAYESWKSWVVSPDKSFHVKWQAFDLKQNDAMKNDIVSQVLLDVWLTRAANWERWHWSYWEWPDTFGWVPSNYWYWENPMSSQIATMRTNKKLNADQKKDLTFASQAYWIMYNLANNWDIDHLLKSSEWQKLLANLKKASFIQNWEDATWAQVLSAIKNWMTDQRNLQTVNDLINVIELKLRKVSWAAIAASEWTTNFEELLPWVNEDYSVSKHKYETFENAYLREFFDSAGAGQKWYSYKALFSPQSPYYKYDNYVELNTSRFNTPTYFENAWAGDSQNLIYYNWKTDTWDNIWSNWLNNQK